MSNSAATAVVGVGTSIGPSLACWNGLLYMAWKGTATATANDQRIWYSSFDGSVWAPQAGVPGGSTLFRPSLAAFDGVLYLAWKGLSDDQAIYYASFDGTSWTTPQSLPGAGTGVGPSLVVFNGVLYMAWRGTIRSTSSDQRIFYSSFESGTWSAQQVVPGVATLVLPSLAVYGGLLYMAWKGASTDQGIWYTTFDGTTWAPQSSVPGVGTSIGPSLAVFDGLLYMAWKGTRTSTANDTGIWSSTFDGTAWAPQTSVASVATLAGPSLAPLTTAAGEALYMAWRGPDADQAIYYVQTTDGVTWT